MKERTLKDIFDLITTLRSENGCPWDREQTLGDIISSIIEEAYELEWAYQTRSAAEVFEELGDVFFLSCYAAALLEEKDPSVSIGAITTHAFEKIKRRHPHVFEGKKAANKEESMAHWNRIKASERAAESSSASGLGNLKNLPPLRRAEHLQRAAASVGFDWDDAFGIIEKLREEVEEAVRCIGEAPKEALRDEVGDLFFTVVNLSRFLNISAESALSHANAKFARRFQKMESLIKNHGKKLDDLTLDEMDTYWKEAKDDVASSSQP